MAEPLQRPQAIERGVVRRHVPRRKESSWAFSRSCLSAARRSHARHGSRPASCLSSSTTGSERRLYLSNSSATFLPLRRCAACTMWPCGRRLAERSRRPAARHDWADGDDALAGRPPGDVRDRLEIAFELAQRVRLRLRRRAVLRARRRTRSSSGRRRSLRRTPAALRPPAAPPVHLVEDGVGPLVGQLGEQVGGGAGVHLFDDARDLFRVERSR